MSVAGATALVLVDVDPPPGIEALLDPVFLTAAGWDAASGVLTPPPEHPSLGYALCPVRGCPTRVDGATGLCRTCFLRLATVEMDRETFIAAGVSKRLLRGASCSVPGCPRPCKSPDAGLCTTHHWQRVRTLKVPMAVFLAHPQVTALASFGACRVLACPLQAQGRSGFCATHHDRLVNHQRRGLAEDVTTWCRTEPATSNGRIVSLRGLTPLLRAEVLLGVQERDRQGLKTDLRELHSICNTARRHAAASLDDVPIALLQRRHATVLKSMLLLVQRRMHPGPQTQPDRRVRLHAGPDSDRWDMATFGHRGSVDFTALSQPWLRETAKRWASDQIPRRRGNSVAGSLREHIRAVVLLSENLRDGRDDHGVHPDRLGRADAERFLHRLAHLAAAGTISAYRRSTVARMVHRVLLDARDLGLTRPGEPMAGYPSDFAIRRDEITPEDRDGPGRALPDWVIATLCGELPALETATCRQFRIAVELLIDTGRRPDEICRLPWDCLHVDASGKYTLVYTDWKNNRAGRRLPIPDATAAIISGQKQAVHDAFPDLPVSELFLLPAPKRNAHGVRPLSDDSVSNAHRRWVNSLPPMIEPDRTEFDKPLIIPYAYRHSYAQRHADAGTPIDVLRDLMAHRSMTTTQLYYRVGEQRTRRAVEQLTNHQLDRGGNHIWRQTEALLDHEHARMRIGQVAVPFGTCTEPSNVKAGGHACPFRMRCLGCGHFRTDPSYLPELRSYLQTLLTDRERALAAAELDEWARAEATPSTDEIGRLRTLIRRVEHSLDDLTDDDRQQITEAIAVLRKTRQSVNLGMPYLATPTPDPRLDRPA